MSGGVLPQAVIVTFEPTDEEWRLVETRAAFRAMIGEGGLARRLAPVALFATGALTILGLKWGGAVGSRTAQIGLVVVLAGFVVANSVIKRGARRMSRRRILALRAWRRVGAITLRADPARTAMSGAGWLREWPPDSGGVFELFEGLLLLWSGDGPPAFAPRRSLSDAEGEALRSFWRGAAQGEIKLGLTGER